MLESGYAIVRSYWPDVLAFYVHKLVHWLGTISLVGLPLVFLRYRGHNGKS
jgi:hypothetical protein